MKIKNKICKISAFTLAEVLITLGIIGIVAAMTIPTLMTKIQKRKLETQLKETYSVIQQTMKAAEGDGANFQTAFQDGSNEAMKEWFEEFIQPHLKTESVCYNKAGCWHKYNEAKDLNGKRYEYDINPNNIGWGSSIMTFTIPNGAFFNMDGYAISSCKNKFGINTNEQCLGIFFDVNGSKKPNVIGKDIYMVIQTENGLVPAGKDKTKEEVNNNCNNGNGVFCLQKVINDSFTISEKVLKR